jgi:hypothetical protein
MTPEKAPKRMTAFRWFTLAFSILSMVTGVQGLSQYFSTPHEWNLKDLGTDKLWLPVLFIVSSVGLCFEAFRRPKP